MPSATRITVTGHGSSATPLNDPSDAGSASEGGGMGSKAELHLARLHARTSLASLPAPKNDVTGQIPDDITEEEKELLESEAVRYISIERSGITWMLVAEMSALLY